LSPGTHAPRPSKRFGQHFLRSREALERIVEIAEICEQDTVLEIGAGLGDLTVHLARRAREVLALELDRRLHSALLKRVRDAANIRVIEEDALRFPLPEGLRGMPRPRKVVANLPYNVGTRILLRFAQFPAEIDLMALMFQREVAERITARVGTRAYGGISVLLALHWDSRMVFKVPPGAFRPSPKVESALVVLRPLERARADVGDPGIFQALVRAAFSQRRKTLLNALQGWLGGDKNRVARLLHSADIHPGRRAETLSLEEFARLGRAASTLGQEGSESPL
jgi:16S rRNA (adenine1518-N6/adenine1519-N6)-dimethyltransferase